MAAPIVFLEVDRENAWEALFEWLRADIRVRALFDWLQRRARKTVWRVLGEWHDLVFLKVQLRRADYSLLRGIPPPPVNLNKRLPGPARVLLIRFCRDPPYHRVPGPQRTWAHGHGGERKWVTVLGRVLGCPCDRCRWGGWELPPPDPEPDEALVRRRRRR